MSGAPDRPQVAILRGGVLELVIVDKDGLFQALPGAAPLPMPLSWHQALAAHAERSAVKARTGK